MNTLFNVPTGPYFLSHSVGCLPVSSEQQLDEQILTPWKQKGGHAWHDWLNTIYRFHEAVAHIINAPTAGVCAQVNLSSGLSKLLTALPNLDFTGAKPCKVLMHASAFPTMGFVVKALSRFGFELVLIDESHSPCEMNTWQQAVTSDIDVCLVTHVHSNTGQLSPVAHISELCKSLNVLCVVDVAQSIGVVPIDAAAWQVDAILGSCVKWLCGGPGASFIWVKDTLLQQLTPTDVGWFSHENPFEFDIRHFKPANNAMKLLGGTPSVAPYALALNGINTIDSIGVDAIRSHNTELKQVFIDRVQNQLIKEPMLEHQGGTLCLNFTGHIANMEALTTAMTSANMHFDQRGNVIRVSFHIYNTREDIHELADCICQSALMFAF